MRDVRQQGLETALHFWGLLVLISVAIGLIVGVAIVAVRWWLNRNGSTPNEPTKLC